jgi:uncharacterized membrane protein
MGNAERLARGLGWFSIGLGIAQIAAPRRFEQVTGVDEKGRHPLLVRAIGVREIACGIGALTQRRPAGWIWARVMGDAMDLTLLGAAFTSRYSEKDRLTASTAAVMGVTVLDVMDALQLSREKRKSAEGQREEKGIHVRQSITINRSPDEVYRLWRNFENLPRFMPHLESVEMRGDRRSHWRVKAPAGKTVEWEAEIVDERPNELIAWRALEGSDVRHSGVVRFRPAPGGRGTEVEVELTYNPPGGIFGANFAKLFGQEPGQQVRTDLRAFKQFVETGEITKSDATVRPGPHPARPPAPAGRS